MPPSPSSSRLHYTSSLLIPHNNPSPHISSSPLLPFSPSPLLPFSPSPLLSFMQLGNSQIRLCREREREGGGVIYASISFISSCEHFILTLVLPPFLCDLRDEYLFIEQILLISNHATSAAIFFSNISFCGGKYNSNRLGLSIWTKTKLTKSSIDVCKTNNVSGLHLLIKL